MQDHCRWCVGAHIQAFTFSSQDRGRLLAVYVSKHSFVVCVVCMCWCGVWCVCAVVYVLRVCVCVGWACCGDVCVSSCLAPKTLPCVRSKRSRVYFQNARVTKDTGVLNVHTRAFSTYTRERLSLLFSRLSPLVSPSRFFSCLSLSFSSLSVTMTMITLPVGSLCTHSSDLP